MFSKNRNDLIILLIITLGLIVLAMALRPCTFTVDEYDRWSEWKIDPTDSLREFRIRTVSSHDVIVGNTVCGNYKEIEFRPAPSNPDDTVGNLPQHSAVDYSGLNETTNIKSDHLTLFPGWWPQAEEK